MNTLQTWVVDIKNNQNMTFCIILDPGFYRYFLKARKITCQNSGDGVYIHIDYNGLNFLEAIIKPMAYDCGKEVKVVIRYNMAATINLTNPFQNLFNLIVTTLIKWLIIIGAALFAAIIIIICVLLVKCCCKHYLFVRAQLSAPGASVGVPAESA
jgi:hypothetical protein